MTSGKKIKLSRSGRRALLGPYRFVVIQGLSFFIAAGNWAIPRIWLYIAVCLCGAVIGTVVSLRYLKDLLNVRGARQAGAKRWDVVLLISYFTIHLLLMPIVAGLETARFNGPGLGTGYVVAGSIIYLLAYTLILWAMLVNRHFEGLVRIQNDRHHTVITSGPYRFVRHPGYVGMILLAPVMPFMVGSLWALLPAGVCILLIIARTYLEDRTLQRELAGYTAYAAATRYRLLPAVW